MEIAAGGSDEWAQIRFADPAMLFRERALRLRQLAASHAMRDFLIFAADVADAQHAALQGARSVVLPTETILGQAAKQGVAPLAYPAWGLSLEWQDDLQLVLQRLQARADPGPIQAVLHEVQALDADALQAQANKLLSGVMLGLNMAHAPLLGAALQLYWTRLVLATQAAHPDLAFGLVDSQRLCPCCGSEPVASVAHLVTEQGAARYLHCGLCQTQWHMVRIKCAHCESTTKITYQELETQGGADAATLVLPKGAVRAECCGDCHHYLKIVDMNKDAHVDPVADDLASVTLDLLVSEAGWTRHGVNLMLLWGDDESQDAPQSPGAS